MRKFYSQLKAVVLALLIIFPLFSVMQLIPEVEAEQGSAKVYVLQLSGVGAWWVDDTSQARQGAIEASTPAKKNENIPRVHPKHGKNPPFYSVSYQVITSWSTYENVILNQVGGILVNTHGEILPVPSGYTKEAWVDTIAEAMTYRRLTWAHMAGYPFYWIWYEGDFDQTSWGVDGFKALMSHIGLGNVELWPPASGLETDMYGEAGQYLFSDGSGWHMLHSYAHRVDLSRPLKKSDFADCTILPLYRRVHDSEEYWEGAIIAFAKPGAWLDPEETEGFGSYVHLGTSQTYSVGGSPTDRDYSRGYVVTAAAIWAEALGFESYSAFNSNDDPYYPRNVSLHVAPVIAGYGWEPSAATFKVRLVLSLYGALKANELDHAHTIEEVGIILTNVPDDTHMKAQLDISKNGEETGIKLEGLWEEDPNKRYLGLITPSVLWILPVFVPQSLPFVVAASGFRLFCQWVLPVDQRPHQAYEGVDNPASSVHFYYDPLTTYTDEGDVRYEEFQSLIAIDILVPISGRVDWRVIPIDFWIKLFTGSQWDVEVEAGLSIAMWFDEGNKVMVSFEDFSEDISEWNVGDDDSTAGYDYWGISSTPRAWCAQVGDNSITGTPNVEAGIYDKGMDAYLVREVDLRPYQSAELSYHVDYYIKAGDYLHVQYYADGSWSDPPLKSYTDGLDEKYEPPISLPINAQKIGFRFISNDDDNVAWGAFIDNVQITAIIPNDAINQNIDAGNDFNSATAISVSSSWKNYAGYLDPHYADDIQDWYKFYAISGKKIQVEVNSPSGTDFDVEIYNPSGQKKAGPGDYVSTNTDASGNWRIKVYIVSGFGQYSFDIKMYTTQGGGGGCPYVSTWNGTDYVLDNNLLAASETSNGSDVIDYYMLQRSLIQDVNGACSLLVSEFENEHGFFDQVKLLVVDHQLNVGVAVSPYGEVLTYTEPSPPVSAVDDNSKNVKQLLGEIDGDYYEGYNGSYIVLNFGEELDVSQGAKLVMRADWPPPQKIPSIHVQIQDEDHNWNDVAKVNPRVYWATEIFDLSEYLPDPKGNLKVRLYFTAEHKVDFVGLDTSPQATTDTHGGQLISAIHTTQGDVTTSLSWSDEVYAELVPQQDITLTFTLPPRTLAERSFLLITEGHYYTIPI